MMTRFSRILAAALAVVSLVLAAGCEQRPTGYDPNPNSPEGVPTAAAQLLAYRNAGLRVLARDYQSANIDSAESFAQAFPGPTTMPLLLLLDGTPANTFELYRINGGGKFERTADYPLQSIFKYVNAGYESFFSTDPSPGTYAPPSYLARGLVNGVASHQSPLSNEGRLTGSGVLPITYNGDLQPIDSLFTVSWVGVPGAVGYWVHIYEKPTPGAQRLESSLPAPIAYITAGDEFIGYRAGNNPGGSVQFKLGDTSLLTLKYIPALLGHDYFVRVTGIDATGQVIAQTPGNLDSLAMSADLAYLAPPTYSPDKTKLYFSLGGTKVARRALTPRITDGDGAQGAAPAMNLTVVRHNPLIQSPYVGPFRSLTPLRRAGNR
jgi:hypothetical protein